MSTNARFLVVTDLETTGLNQNKHEIIEIGRVVVDLREKRIVPNTSIKVYVRPENWVTHNPEAMKVNRLSLAKLLAEGVSLGVALGDFSRGIDWTQSVIASWGTDFELKFLEAAFQKTNRVVPYTYKSVDIRSWAFLPLAMAGWEEYPGLQEACEIYGIDMDPELLHDAEYDARKTAELAIYLLTDYDVEAVTTGSYLS